MSTVSSGTSGVKIYLCSTVASPHTVLPVDQLKGVSMFGGGSRKKIDISNFDSMAYDELQGGRAAPPEATGELVLDLGNTNHKGLKLLFEAQASGSAPVSNVYAGFSNSTAAPTIVAGALQPPVTASPKHWSRSGILGNAYISTLTPKGADNDVWRADFKMQFTGKAAWSVKGQTMATTY